MLLINRVADYLFVEQINAVNGLTLHFSKILFVDCVADYFRNPKVDCSLT